MNLGALAKPELIRRLRGQGLCFRSGPFVISLKASLHKFLEPFRQLYHDFPVIDDCDFADYHVSIQQSGGLRGLFKSEGTFTLGGYFRFQPFPIHMELAYLEWGFNCSISGNAHQYLILHSAVLERGGHGVIILGPSGAGKSTLCAGMSQRRWRLFSDELGLISPRDGKLVPNPRPISLKNESIGIIRELAPEVYIGPIATSDRKGTMAHMQPDRESVLRAGETAQPRWILFLNYQPGEQPRFDEVSKAQAMIRAAKNAFNYGLLGFAGFEALASAVDASSCYQFTYGDLSQALDYLDRVLVPQEATV